MSTREVALNSSSARLSLHVNGAALFAVAVVGYALTEGSWWLFAGLLLVPDIFMLGYLAGTRIGADVYNFGHSLLWPAALVGLGLLLGDGAAQQGSGQGLLALRLGLIWAAHIGMDRALGYGYKYADAFRNTDIGRA